MECCGRGYHKRRKKGARRAFFRQKNDECRRQQANKENHGVIANTAQQMPTLDAFTVTLSDVQESMASVSLPSEDWLVFPGDGMLQWSRMEIGHGGVQQPTTSVLLSHDLSWSVHIYGKKVPATCKLLASFPSLISSPTIISGLLNCIHYAAICPGNPDERFVTLCEKRGGTIKKGGDVIAYLDNSSLVGCRSVRRVECEIICDLSSRRLRCQACQSFRSTLRSAVHRTISSKDDNTAASSHTNYKHLTPDEKSQRMKNLHQSLRVAKQQAKRLQAKVDEMIENGAVPLPPNDAEDLTQIMDDVSPIVAENFPEKTLLKEYFGISRGPTTGSETSAR